MLRFDGARFPTSLATELESLIDGQPEGALVSTAERGDLFCIRDWRNRGSPRRVGPSGLDDMGLMPHEFRHTTASPPVAWD